MPFPRRQPFATDFYDRDPREVAHDLIGQWLVSLLEGELVGGRIVEAEAYLNDNDSASHAASGPNRKNRAMFGPPGCAYVYVIHARHCFNVVTEAQGCGSAVLIRALEPLWGIETMTRRRTARRAQVCRPRELTTGPARLCEALAIDRQQDGLALTVADRLWIEPSDELSMSRPRLRTPRIGVTSAHEHLYRFVESDNPYASGPKRWRSSETASERHDGKSRGRG